MTEPQRFETCIVPHLDAAFNLARWLLRSDQQAEDAVQEAAIRALRYLGSLRDGGAKPWFLGIVRNTCFTALARIRDGPDWVEFDEQVFEGLLVAGGTQRGNPEDLLDRAQTRRRVDAALRALSPPLREAIILREFENLDYAAMAQIMGVAIGTVMSRLSRAREKLRAALATDRQGG